MINSEAKYHNVVNIIEQKRLIGSASKSEAQRGKRFETVQGESPDAIKSGKIL